VTDRRFAPPVVGTVFWPDDAGGPKTGEVPVFGPADAGGPNTGEVPVFWPDGPDIEPFPAVEGSNRCTSFDGGAHG